MVEYRPTTATGGRRPSPRPAAPTSPGGTTNLFARRRMGRRTKPSGHAYSLLLKDSVIYGGGRMLQKFLTALMLPLFTAFLTKSDYGIVGMVVTVTTFLDVFVTLGFDVAFTRFYFDDKSTRGTAARSSPTSSTWSSSTRRVLLGRAHRLHAADLERSSWAASGYTIYFDIGVATLFFTNLSDLPFTLLRLEHRPWTFTTFTIARVLIQVPMASSSSPSSTGAPPATWAPTSSRPSSSTSPPCRSTSASSASSGTGS